MHENYSILVVEDCESDAFLLQRGLQSAGLSSVLHVANDGQHAMDYLAGLKQFADRKLYPFPDLVMLDLRLPKQDGFQVLDWIRQQPTLAGLLVVTMSSNDSPAIVKRVQALGAVAHLTKRSNYNALGPLFKSLIGYPEQLRQWQQQSAPRGPQPEPPPFFDGRTD